MLIDTLNGILALLSGAILGVFYFVGLWWTVRQLGSSRYVALLFISSMLFRTSAVVVGFYYILGDNWLRLVAGMIGFILVRVATTYYFQKTKATEPLKNRPSMKSAYEP